MTRPSLVLVHSPVLGPTSVQPMARALSGLGWICLVPALNDAPSVAGHITAAAAAVPDGSVLVAHSGAGAFVPAIAAHAEGRVAGAVFVDARLPDRGGVTALAEPSMIHFLAGLARDGIVPPWSQWWGDGAFEAMVPDAALAAGMRSEMRSLPLDFFRSEVAVPPGWPDTPCAYLQLSPAYDAEAADARARGWSVAERAGTHLDPATRPVPTAAALDALLERLP